MQLGRAASAGLEATRMSTDDLVGERLGRFHIQALLGQGAMAKVYKARHEVFDRVVALKVIRRIPGDDEDLAARFEREKVVLKMLDHPNIMPIHDYSANIDFLWIGYPLIAGGTLEDQLKKGSLPLADVVRIVRQLGSALDMAGAQSIVHRDIKPSNVMLDGDRCLLTDFGVAKLLEAEGLTAPGMTLGTPEYMSPEQVLGKPLDTRSDQYALGVLAYHLISGSVPFSGKMVQVMQQHAKSSPPSLGKRVPAEVEKALFQALAKDPAKRYPSSSDFAEALAAAAGDTVLTPVVPDVSDLPTVKPAAAHAPAVAPAKPTPWALYAGGAVAFVAACGLAGRLSRPHAAPTPTPTKQAVHSKESKDHLKEKSR